MLKEYEKDKADLHPTRREGWKQFHMAANIKEKQ